MYPLRRIAARSNVRLPRLALALLGAVLLGAAPPAGAMARVASQKADCSPPSAGQVEAIARAYFAAFNTGDAAALDVLLAPDYLHHGAIVTPQDHTLHVERMLDVRRGFPDGVFTIDWLIVDGDTVAVRNTFRGTHQGTYTGIPASGRPVAVSAFHVHRIACGRIAETWNAGDGIGLLRQIGVIPGPPTTPADEEPRAPVAAQRTPCPATTTAQNTAMARRWYDQVLNRGQFEVLDEILAEDVVHHAAVFVDLVGREQTGGSLRALRAGFPDIEYTVDGVVAAGDTVLIRWTGRGTQTGEFLGFAPTGARVEWQGMNAFRFSCGVIVEGWSEANGLDVLRQMGVIP